jgi:hypothetical protein
MPRGFWLSIACAVALAATAGTAAQDRPPAKPAATPATPSATPGPQASDGEWRSMFDGTSLAGWKESPFVARGKVTVEKGQIILGSGYITGVTWTKAFPTANYEIRYQAARVQGSDFFAAVTFPVHDSFCTFVNGGWGGMVVGLSSLDSMDASENDTTTTMSFTTGRWYSFRVRVTDNTIEAWIDDERVVFVNVQGRQVGLRPGEIENSTPLGFASYESVGALRNIEYRLLNPRGY